ncbi:MAG: BREX-3 system P-loop-containing protein BrxF [Sedimentibacter sp.]
MSIKCSLYEIDKLIDTYNDYLIISLVHIDTIKNKFNDYKILELSELLSSELIKIEQGRRSMGVENIMRNIFSSVNGNNIIVNNIDILFNPSYKLDIIKLFVQLSRNRTVLVQWPGRLDSNALIYSEPQYEDYKRYSINDYNIICLG